MIVGTAGHIDHGKTSLVRVLTGVDTDRLPEERRRGITIELGFAPLELRGIGTVGVVDVPGHEAFVRTMVAGATGIDIALIVIAADEGVMPQTREHLAVLELLGVTRGVVALTKRDLVDDEWLTLVTDDVRETLESTALAGSEIVPVSATTGLGVIELREALAQMAATVPARARDDLFRLPVDRAFTVRGTGTVVTGTVWSGRIAPDDAVRVLPGNHAARVRGVQTHGASVATAHAGERAAVALVGLAVETVPRGSTLVTDGAWRETRLLRATATVLPDALASLGARTGVRLHLGTSDVRARVVRSGGPLEPGMRDGVRIVLDAPVVARAGDRFVLRALSPATTIGGGVVTDPAPPRRRARPWPADPGDTLERLDRIATEAGREGVTDADLVFRLGVPWDEYLRLIPGAAAIVAVGTHVYARGILASAISSAIASVHRHVEADSLESGLATSAIRAELGGGPLADAAIVSAVDEGALEIVGGLARPPGWQPMIGAGDTEAAAAIELALGRAGREPPSVAELAARIGPRTPALLRFLERAGRVTQVEQDRFYSAEAIEKAVADLRHELVAGRSYAPGELRDVLGVSRKYLIPLLEFLDRIGVTDRVEGGRALRGT